MVNVAEAPEAGVATVQVLLEELFWLTVVEPSAKPAGKVSATDTLWASDGPLLCTVIDRKSVVQGKAVTVVARSVLLMDRSALVLTVPVSRALLLFVLGSLVLLLTVAVLVWLAVVEDGTV